VLSLARQLNSPSLALLDPQAVATNDGAGGRSATLVGAAGLPALRP
jgi:hypothetical protein